MSPPEDIVYKFASFSLDSARGALLSAEQTELPLRPKAFALLRLFVINPGRLLDRNTILDIIWPKVIVTEDSITQCVREIRAALGDRSQVLIRTVKGRGYVLSAAVSMERFPAPNNEPLGETTAHVPAAVALKAPLFDPPRLSLVVLPFASLSNDRDQQFLADGITMDLTTELSRIRNALVISSNTAFTYRNKPIETTQIARELDIRFVLEGSVQRSGSRIRAVASNRNWASAIGFLGAAKLTAGLLDDVIPIEERAIRLSPRDPQLWMFFFCIGATHFFQLRFEEAIDWFERSQSHQPNLALPNGYLAAAFALTGKTGRAGFHLFEARRLSTHYKSVADLKASFKINAPALAALYERIYFAGLIKAGLPES